ncbi:LOW QUALITY PROTEIN: histamine H4 receptor [Megaptera novaeangliae]
MPATNDTTDLPSETSIALAFLMSLLAFAIMVGNAVVILAFVVDKNLRHSNYFFLNLAISDFFVGVISIPLYIPHRLFNWKFEDNICAFWLTIDYLLCTSVYNIVLISFDQYQSVSNAVSCRAQHTGILKIVVLMVAIWVVAFVHGPIILVSEAWKNGKGDCEPGFFTEWYIPLLLLFQFIGFLTTPVENRYRCYSYSTEEETKEYMTGPRWYNQQIMKPELELRESEI